MAKIFASISSIQYFFIVAIVTLAIAIMTNKMITKSNYVRNNAMKKYWKGYQNNKSYPKRNKQK